MTSILRLAIGISRPKFWGYLAGPYAVGFAAGAYSFTQFFDLNFLLHILYFLTIANLYVYGLNDLSDRDTDALNAKKGTKEYLFLESEHNRVRILVAISIVTSLVMVLLQPTFEGKALFIIFLLLSGLYSVHPIRFKARAFLDFSSNIHYALPAFLAYNYLTGTLPPLTVWIAAFCWTGAMHLYSAVPDIAPDKKSGVYTTAVVLGTRRALFLTILLWTVTAAILTSYTSLLPITAIAWIYPIYATLTLYKPDAIHKLYWYFPYINTLVGAILFFLLLFSI